MLIESSQSSIRNRCLYCGTEVDIDPSILKVGTATSDSAISLPNCLNCGGPEELLRDEESPITHAAYVNGLFKYIADNFGTAPGKGHLVALPPPENFAATPVVAEVVPRVGTKYAQRVSVFVTVYTVGLIRSLVESDPDFLTDEGDGAIGAFVASVWATEADRNRIAKKLRDNRIREFGA